MLVGAGSFGSSPWSGGGVATGVIMGVVGGVSAAGVASGVVVAVPVGDSITIVPSSEILME